MPFFLPGHTLARAQEGGRGQRAGGGTCHTAVGKGCSTWTLHHAVRGILRTCMYRTRHGTTAGPSHGPTPHGREREFSKPERNTMNTTEAATNSCWRAYHSLRSMHDSLQLDTFLLKAIAQLTVYLD